MVLRLLFLVAFWRQRETGAEGWWAGGKVCWRAKISPVSAWALAGGGGATDDFGARDMRKPPVPPSAPDSICPHKDKRNVTFKT